MAWRLFFLSYWTLWNLQYRVGKAQYGQRYSNGEYKIHCQKLVVRIRLHISGNQKIKNQCFSVKRRCNNAKPLHQLTCFFQSMEMIEENYEQHLFNFKHFNEYVPYSYQYIFQEKVIRFFFLDLIFAIFDQFAACILCH